MQAQQEIRRPSLQAMALTLAALAALVLAGLGGYLVRNVATSQHGSVTTSTAETGAGAPAGEPGQTICIENVCIEEGTVQAPAAGPGSFTQDPGIYAGLTP
jgi:hypothetical protein